MPPVKSTNTVHLGGKVEPGFEKVAEAFGENFQEGLDTGASFSVYHKGKKVVHLWGGYKDKRKNELWTENTLCMAWSCTKAVGAICLARLAEQGYLDYDKPVSQYWPEFAEKGKHNITVSQMLSHQAGLPLLDGDPITWEMAKSCDIIGSRLAKQKPLWEPGSGHGYHAFTMGWLMDQLLRRVDPKRRSLAVYFNDEIAQPLGLDFRIGTPSSEEHRIAWLEDKQFQGIKHMLFHEPEKFWHLLCIYLNPFSLYNKTMKCAKNFCGANKANCIEYHQLELPQCNGIGTASSLAQLMGILANGGTDIKTGYKVLSAKTCESLNVPVSIGMDKLYALEGMFSMVGHGLEVTIAEGNTIFGHPGYGGQELYADPTKSLGWCYLTSRLTAYGVPMDDPRYKRLRDAMYESVKHLEMDCQSVEDLDLTDTRQ